MAGPTAGLMKLGAGSPPSPPATGYVAFYVDAGDGKFYKIDEFGTITEVGAGSSPDPLPLASNFIAPFAPRSRGGSPKNIASRFSPAAPTM